MVGTKQDACVWNALTDGKIPVVITDAFELPQADTVDYPRFLFQIGTCASELSLLSSLQLLEPSVIQKMQTAGQEFLSENPSLELPHLLEGKSPCCLADGRLLREREWFQFLWEKLSGRILIFGAGKFLHRLMDATSGGKNGAELIGIADDAAKEPGKLYGVTFAKGEAFDPADFDAVLLATDCLEPVFKTRVSDLYGPDTPVLSLTNELMKYPDLSAAGQEDELLPLPASFPPAHYPKKLEAVVVCVGYADFLSWTLPENVNHFDRLVVVTSSKDIATQQIVRNCGAELVISDRYCEEGAAFNKGKMFNDGLARLEKDGWILLSDADILLRRGFRRRILSRLLNEQSLYYITRLNTPATGREEWLNSWFAKPEKLHELTFCDLLSNQNPWGYFQLYHGSTQTNYSEAYETASLVDIEFQERWSSSHRVLLPEIAVHIAHGELGENWNGRTSEPLRTK